MPNHSIQLVKENSSTQYAGPPFNIINITSSTIWNVFVHQQQPTLDLIVPNYKK